MTIRRALVTGSSEGIGRAFVKRLAAEGWAVTVVARNEARLRALVSEIPSVEGDHRVVACDLSTGEGVRRVVAEIEGTPYDLLINNAGFGLYRPFVEAPLAQLNNMIQLNITALVTLAHAYLQRARKGDTLVNVSSVLAFAPMPTASVYSATKAFVTSFSDSLWAEHSSRGVFVLGLCPGATASEFHARAEGGDGMVPAWMTQTFEQVVDAAMAAIARRRNPVIVSGLLNKTMVLFTRLIPRWLVARVMDPRPKK
jgi:short-subunit dehydrogenase